MLVVIQQRRCGGPLRASLSSGRKENRRNVPPKVRRRLSSVKTSPVGPAASTVRSISTARSQNRGTEPRLCVATSITRPSARNSFNSATIESSVVTSTPVKGSSSRITCPSCASARARKTRFFCPPESSPIWRRAKSVMPTRSSASATLARSAARAILNGPMRP
jgi:hypothetical protein